MKAFTKLLAGGVAIAALASAAPAAAQYYPGYPGYGYGGGGNVVGQVLNQVLGGGYNNGYGGYGYGAVNSQAAVSQCVGAVQARLNGGGYGGYGAYGYGNNGYGQARVLGISRVEQRSSGGLTVRGVANSGRYASAYGYNGQAPVDLTFKCKTDYRGFVTEVDVDRAQGSYGYNSYTPYSTYGNDYSQYGYRRY
ncbi:MAG TPA: hypothetical protein VM145_05005 [Sphingomicrobium sp.]|nr:hypothetical protein [Sphingomicrobium sp.]